MTTKQMKVILGRFYVVYPDAYRQMTAEDVEIAAKTWCDLFADVEYPELQEAASILMRNRISARFPTPGELSEQLYKLRHPAELSASDAWSLVLGAAANSGYHAQEEFDALPDSVRRVIGSAAQLREYGMMDTSELNTVVASNFRRAYEARRESQREWEALPPGTKEVAQEIAASVFKTLPEGRD